MPVVLIRWPGAPGGRAAAAQARRHSRSFSHAYCRRRRRGGAKGASHTGRDYKLHLDGFAPDALFSGKSDQNAKKNIFYYDETVLMGGSCYKQGKITFSAKEGNRSAQAPS